MQGAQHQQRSHHCYPQQLQAGGNADGGGGGGEGAAAAAAAAVAAGGAPANDAGANHTRSVGSTAGSANSGSPNVVGVHYRVGRKIGEGSFGVIYEGTNLLNNLQVAIKFESRKSDAPQLRDEYRTYKIIAGCGESATFLLSLCSTAHFLAGLGLSAHLPLCQNIPPRPSLAVIPGSPTGILLRPGGPAQHPVFGPAGSVDGGPVRYVLAEIFHQDGVH
ncbi:MAG: hypothetical protein BJ554DRAFT_3580, partial [Olpidium bornovanus]